MSAFLGPIHHWLFRKIQLQQELVEQVLDQGEKSVPGIKDELDSLYGIVPKGPLEDLIDLSNIHGWLSQQVSKVEYKLADGVTRIHKKDPEAYQVLRKRFYEVGKAHSQEVEDSAQVYQLLSDLLLDGMPCDHANLVESQDDNQVTWIRNTCVHKRYWDDVNGECKDYYELREELLKGLLVKSPFIYEKVNEVTNQIRRVEG